MILRSMRCTVLRHIPNSPQRVPLLLPRCAFIRSLRSPVALARWNHGLSPDGREDRDRTRSTTPPKRLERASNNGRSATAETASDGGGPDTQKHDPAITLLRTKWWEQRTRDFKNGSHRGVLRILEERGFVNQIAGNRDDLNRVLSEGRVGVYVGIDPTASSMHVGHLVPFMALLWTMIYGHTVTFLIGRATASIGDPTGRSTSRPKVGELEMGSFAANITSQLNLIVSHVDALLERYAEQWSDADKPLPKGLNSWAVRDNLSWLRFATIGTILRTVGDGLRLGPLLGRETVKTKMSSAEGMSVSEFCYPLLQAYDWWWLYYQKNVQVQIGGADQYGNILSGIDAIKHTAQSDKNYLAKKRAATTPMGLTVPLLTTASGEKFGKSSDNAVWLSKSKTSVFDLYGFFVRQSDADVERLLKLFTFLPIHMIEQLMTEHKLAPEKRIAQHSLAREFVELIHGPVEAQTAQRQHQALFGLDSENGLNISSLVKAFGGPTGPMELCRGAFIGIPFTAAFQIAGLESSKSDAARLIKNKGAYVCVRKSTDEAECSEEQSYTNTTTTTSLDGQLTFTRVLDAQAKISQDHLLVDPEGKKYLILRSGKGKVRVLALSAGPDDDE